MKTNFEKTVKVSEDVYELIKKCNMPISKILSFSLCSLKAYHETQDKRGQRTL